MLQVLLATILEMLEEIDVPIDPTLVEDCHRLPSKGSPKKVIVKLNRRKDIHRILSNKNKLKNLKPESVHLPGETKVFINKSLSLYYKKLRSKCKKVVEFIFPRFGSGMDRRVSSCPMNLCP